MVAMVPVARYDVRVSSFWMAAVARYDVRLEVYEEDGVRDIAAIYRHSSM